MESDKRIDRRLQKFGKDIGMDSDKRIDRRIKRAFQDGLAGGNSGTATTTTTARETSNGDKTKALTDLAAAAAVVSGGILLAKGKHGAGATLLATGATTYVASEAMRGAHARRHRCRRDPPSFVAA